MYNTAVNVGLILAAIAIVLPGATLVLAPALFEPEMVFGQLYAIIYMIFTGLDKMVSK